MKTEGTRRASALLVWAVASVVAVGCTVPAGIDVPAPTWPSQSSHEAPEPSDAHVLECAEVAGKPAYAVGAGPADYMTDYRRIDGDTASPVTKFGGQPTWVDEPQWPLSRSTGARMEFIGQVALDPDLFPQSQSSMAYIFMTRFEGLGTEFPEIWDPEKGENAVILQPAGTPLVQAIADATGPTVGSEVYVADLERRADPAYISQEVLWSIPEADRRSYAEPIATDKVGGTPYFLQGEEFPHCGGSSTLITQFSYVPVTVNLGDGGVGYAFMDPRGIVGGLLTQSH